MLLPHHIRDCPRKAKLSALVQEEEETPSQHDVANMGSLQLLTALQATIPKASTVSATSERKGRLFARGKIGGKEVRALVDSGATNNFLDVKEAQRLGVTFSKQAGWLKAANSQPKAICGTARDVKLSIGEWSGDVNFSVVEMDDYPIVLGMDFLDRAKAVPLPFSNTMLIMEEGKTCQVPLSRGKPTKAKTVGATRLIKSGREPRAKEEAPLEKKHLPQAKPKRRPISQVDPRLLWRKA